MNGRLKMTQKHKMMAYVLNNDFGYSMDAIGTCICQAKSVPIFN